MGVLRMISPNVTPTHRAGGNRDMSSKAMISPAIIASTSVIAEMTSVICSPDIRKSRLLPEMMSQRNWYLNMIGLTRRLPLRRHDRAELVLVGVLHQSAVQLDRVDEQVDVVQPDLVTRRHDVGVRRDRQLLFRRD